MRHKYSGKVAFIGVVPVAILVLVLLVVPGLSADDVGNLKVDMVIEECDMLGVPHQFENPNPPPLFKANIITVPAKMVKTIETSSVDDKIIFKCISENGAIENNTGVAIQYSFNDPLPLPCDITVNGKFERTFDWHQEISSSGNATLTCKFSPN